MTEKRKVIYGLIVFLVLFFGFSNLDIVGLNRVSRFLGFFDKEANELNIDFLIKPICWLKGGKFGNKSWENQMWGYNICYLAYEDSGKVCNSSKDCLGGCEVIVGVKWENVEKINSRGQNFSDSKPMPTLNNCNEVADDTFDCTTKISGRCRNYSRDYYFNCDGYWERLENGDIRYIKSTCGV